MKTKIIILLFTFFYFLNSSNAQNLSDTLSYERLFFYGKCITLHGKHIGLSKLRRMSKNIPGLEQHFKNINRIRFAEYPLSVTGGIATGLGLGGLLYGLDNDKTIPIIFYPMEF